MEGLYDLSFSKFKGLSNNKKKTILQEIDFVISNWPENLPKGTIHAIFFQIMFSLIKIKLVG